MYTFYWYPKCSTCQKAKRKLDEMGIAYEAIDLKLTPPTSTQLMDWFKQDKFPIKNFFNSSGLVYRDLHLKDQLPTMATTDKAELLASNGMLIKRPLLIKDGKIVQIGYKESDYEAIKK